MRNIIRLSGLTTLLIIALTACQGLIVGNSEVITETRDVSGFNHIDVSGNGNAVIRFGEDYALEIEAESNLMDYLTSDVRGDELVLGIADQVGINATRPITYTITLPTLEAIDLSGNSSAVVPDAVLDGTFSLDLSGASEARFDALTVTALAIELSGSSDVTIATLSADSLDMDLGGSSNLRVNGGEVTTTQLDLSGSSDYNAPNLISQSVTGRASGSSDVTVNAPDTLDIETSGSSDVRNTAS